MISANFVAAVVTVVLRGLADRFLISMQAPVEESSLIPSTASTFLASGLLYWLYKKLKDRNVKILCHQRKSRKILDGRLHKTGSQTSVTSWTFHNRRSRSRSDVGTTNNTSLERLRDSSSTCSLSTKSACSDYRPCNESSTKENSPSIFSVKSDSNADDAASIIKDDELGRFKGYGDWDNNINNNIKRKIVRKKKPKTTRKLRSGRVYSLYM